MLYLNGLIGCLFVVLAVLHFGAVEPLQAIALSTAGATLAFLTLKTELSVNASRVLALLTTVLMFVFFARFFHLAPNLDTQSPREVFGSLFAAFSMIPILSVYSCRLKAECREVYQRKRRAFFSVPRHLEEQQPVEHG